MGNDLEYYGNWLFYGSIIAAIAFGVTIYLRGIRSSHKKLNGTEYLIFGVIYTFPTILLPIWLAPTEIWKKLLITLIIIITGIIHYQFITKKQHELFVNNKSK